MKRKPIIGVTPLWDADRKSVWMLPDYLEGVKAAEGVPVVLPIDLSGEEADRIVEVCDGFLFTGGQDVSPELYGSKNEAIVSSLERDTLESLVLSKALQSDKPVLGICRGLQFINAFLGGTLWQDLPSQHPSDIVHRQGKPYSIPTHEVVLSGELQTAMAVAPDGIVEAAWMPDKQFVWGVQWHPEYLFKTDPDSLAIFSCFISHITE